MLNILLEISLSTQVILAAIFKKPFLQTEEQFVGHQ